MVDVNAQVELMFQVSFSLCETALITLKITLILIYF